jgi:hypothetical protein
MHTETTSRVMRSWPTPYETPPRRCRCGLTVDHGFHHFACLECSAACCAGCAVSLESVTYCRRCAATLLGSAALPVRGVFDLY